MDPRRTDTSSPAAPDAGTHPNALDDLWAEGTGQAWRDHPSE
ncbi:hypothetical protein F8B43_3363 [Methylorubrum populi]|uniref:Uncharacterized protein n=1 Tax=Methylorubrum populi TaxID=223967 RepID=A0A833J661_9HYPH|nr:hypothetical protein F8B43_3363 [Methylorubrum populi]